MEGQKAAHGVKMTYYRCENTSVLFNRRVMCLVSVLVYLQFLVTWAVWVLFLRFLKFTRNVSRYYFDALVMNLTKYTLYQFIFYYIQYFYLLCSARSQPILKPVTGRSGSFGSCDWLTILRPGWRQVAVQYSTNS